MLPDLVAAALLCIGDSITWGGHAGVSQPFCDQLGGQNAGVPGTSTVGWLNNFSVWAAPHLEPDQQVHLLLGANDAAFLATPPVQYAANLRVLIDLLDDAGRTVYLSPQYSVPVPGTELLYIAYAQEVASIWGDGLAQPGAPLFDDPPETIEGVHPTQGGHDHIAGLLQPILIPEAATATLLALGLVALAGHARARRQRISGPPARRRSRAAPR
jgi:lysophospholipase L1-like esterase